MSLSPANAALHFKIWFECAKERPRVRYDAALERLLNAVRAEATTTQAQTLATALADLAVAEDALVSQTALVRAQGERVAALEAGMKPFAEAAENMDGSEGDTIGLWETPEAMMLTYGDLRRAAALLSPPPQDKEGAGS